MEKAGSYEGGCLTYHPISPDSMLSQLPMREEAAASGGSVGDCCGQALGQCSRSHPGRGSISKSRKIKRRW